jgi:uncharacterized membrane protein YkvI
MTAFETYIAIIKGYCGPSLLYVTKAFSNGGFLWSAMALIISGVITITCALKLIKLGKHFKCFSYSQIVLNSLGPKG